MLRGYGIRRGSLGNTGPEGAAVGATGALEGGGVTDMLSGSLTLCVCLPGTVPQRSKLRSEVAHSLKSDLKISVVPNRRHATGGVLRRALKLLN